MKSKFSEIKNSVAAKAGEVFVSTVKATMNAESAADQARRAREKYRGLPTDEIAEALIRTAARKTKWEGAANGLAVSASQAVFLAPVPEPSHKIAAGAGIVGLILGDLAYATKVQIQLLLALAELYGCPFDKEDEDDIYTVFKAALGLKGTERVGAATQFVFGEAARKQFRALLRTGIRRAAQKQVTKVAGQRVGRYLGEKYVMKAIPVINAGIGYALNNAITKRVGKWAKVRAKLRSSTFQQLAVIREQDPEQMVWILPMIFHVGTANGSLSEIVLNLYSQSERRLKLTEAHQQRTEFLINAENLPQIFATELSTISSEEVRCALYQLALTTAAVGLNPTPEDHEVVALVATCLGVAHSPRSLTEKVQRLTR